MAKPRSKHSLFLHRKNNITARTKDIVPVSSKAIEYGLKFQAIKEITPLFVFQIFCVIRTIE